jgi:hypothetical protein
LPCGSDYSLRGISIPPEKGILVFAGASRGLLQSQTLTVPTQIQKNSFLKILRGLYFTNAKDTLRIISLFKRFKFAGTNWDL